MTRLTALAQEIKEKADKQAGSFDDFRGSTSARISALMDVVLKLVQTVEYYSGNEDGETSWQEPDSFVPYWTLWDNGDCVGAEKALEALAYAEERLKNT
jgi:hypothetical protein